MYPRNFFAAVLRDRLATALREPDSRLVGLERALQQSDRERTAYEREQETYLYLKQLKERRRQ